MAPSLAYNYWLRGVQTDAIRLINHLNMSAFRKQFAAQRGAVSLPTFIQIVRRIMGSGKKDRTASLIDGLDDEEVTARLMELFREIDLDGDGEIVWEEFTRFILDKATQVGQQLGMEEVSTRRGQQGGGGGKRGTDTSRSGPEEGWLSTDMCVLVLLNDAARGQALPVPSDAPYGRAAAPLQAQAPVRARDGRGGQDPHGGRRARVLGRAVLRHAVGARGRDNHCAGWLGRSASTPAGQGVVG